MTSYVKFHRLNPIGIQGKEKRAMNNLMVRPFNGISREIDRMFSDFLGGTGLQAGIEGELIPRVNIKDSRDHVTLTFELPGMKREDIKVTVKEGNLIVSGERKFEETKDDENYLRTEIRNGSFVRSFSLPDTVNTDNVAADYRNGMLEIRLAKLEEVKPKEIEVQISGS